MRFDPVITREKHTKKKKKLGKKQNSHWPLPHDELLN